MVLWLNTSGTIGQIITAGTVNITGDLALTFAMIFVLFIAVGMMFKMPIEWILLLSFPLLFLMVLSMQDIFLKIIFGIALMMFAVIFIRNLWLN